MRWRWLYTSLLYLMLPRVLLRLWRRGRREPGYRRDIGERFGRFPQASPPTCIWLHAVSVGETRAAQPIVERLLARHPPQTVVMTHMTPTGRDTGRELYGDRVVRCYLPYDFPAAVARFLDHFRPSLGLIMETEIWFNLIHLCRERGIPVHLVNARLSEKSYRGYARLGDLAVHGLNALRSIAAQSEPDAERFRALGATNVHVTGNVKFDIAPAPELVARGEDWRRSWGAARPVFLAASTRDGEEALLLDHLAAIRVANLLTVLVPRHPQRFDEVAALLERRGIAYRRRSVGLPDAGVALWLGDSMGEMAAYYAACDVAFVGGSLRALGAHNLLEACALGKPVVIGPSVFNFQEATELGIAAEAVVQVADAAGVAEEVARLLNDGARARRMGEAGAAFARSHRGAVARLFTLIGL
ncbi:MAG: lipid IV(A) 3-deoxy-D-manno-octulosonic acid transferase [Burkholderiales bacterium]|nr:lipid IV(A) 3-deoxy-D-manno-octulosonic acid transferase [Burkholderiales bacterium]